MLYIATLGFDEKFIVRFLMRHGIKPKDKFLLLVVKDFEKNEKAKNAYENLRGFIETLIDKNNFFVLPIDIHFNPMKNIKIIVNQILSIPEKEIVACFSGGMRILIILATLSLRFLGDRQITMDIDFEDLSGYKVIYYTATILPKNPRWLEILKRVKQGIYGVRQLAEILGLSPATISRELSELEKHNLIMKKNIPEITELGNAYLDLYSE